MLDLKSFGKKCMRLFACNFDQTQKIMTKRIVLTGGGTAGHVTPNLALIPVLQQSDWNIYYLGSAEGVEKKMIDGVGVPYYSVRCGKLRRYFSWKNFIDPINLFIGIIQSYRILRKLKIDVVFSKGGFVSLPVVIGAYLNRTPVILHESDMTPGLANRLSFPFAKIICVTFEATKKFIKNTTKVEVTGTPIREALFHGDKARGLSVCGFTDSKPCLLVIGGGQGSVVINQCIRDLLDNLCKKYQIIHLCGPGKYDASLKNREGYYQTEYANEDLADFFAASRFILSRSGANSLCEILALQKPHILVPLSRNVSRGDQIQNAKYFEKQGISLVIDEEKLTPETLLLSINNLEQTMVLRVEKMRQLHIASATAKIVDLITR